MRRRRVWIQAAATEVSPPGLRAIIPEKSACPRTRAVRAESSRFRAFPRPDESVTPILESVRRLPARLLLVTFIASVMVPASLITTARAADALVTLNFVNADIDAVIKAVAEITGRNFVVDPKVKGTV